MITVTHPSQLDRFLIATAKQSPTGMRLHEFVLAALHAGFKSKQRSELTLRINKALKRLVRNGTFIVPDNGYILVAQVRP